MDPRSLTKDFREFLQCLNARGVEFLVIGGHAVAFHGYPRATADLDVWIATNPVNASRLTEALRDFGFNVPELSPDLFLRDDRIIRMGVAPNRIEIQTGIDGVKFADCYPRRVNAELDGVRVVFISLPDLKTNKAASRRNKDLADLDHLP
jgi:predicted nucleotidyltransferase